MVCNIALMYMIHYNKTIINVIIYITLGFFFEGHLLNSKDIYGPPKDIP
jgi:hypothetical protein